MAEFDDDRWLQHNGDYITAAVRWVNARLNLAILNAEQTQDQGETAKIDEAKSEAQKAIAAVRQAHQALEQDKRLSTVDLLAKRFKLTVFEKEILLLCLAFELDPSTADRFARLQPQPHPTFALAFRIFAKSSQWKVLLPDRPLQRFRLIELESSRGLPMMASGLRLCPTIVHYLQGIPVPDSWITNLARHVSPPSEPLTDWQLEQSAAIEQYALRSESLIHLYGPAPDQALLIAGHLARDWRRTLYRVDGISFSMSQGELSEFTDVWRRDSILYGLCLAIDAEKISAQSGDDLMRQISFFASQIDSPIFLISREQLAVQDDHVVSFELPQTPVRDRVAMWRNCLPEQTPQRQDLAIRLGDQFSARASVVRGICEDVSTLISNDEIDPESIERSAWHLCRVRSRPNLDGLAARIETNVTWEDLILPPPQKDLLHQIAEQSGSRWRVHQQWGMADRLNRNLGISALFAGESGTGKTLAAEVIAGELNLDLYRVDLSSVVNKYIGETEKRLRKLFDTFDSCGAILFVDECDALFGPRSEVRDSHDRYANIGVNYLLQRLEEFRGLLILATNNPTTLDPAFLRRLRFVVNFEMPDAQQRMKIWRRILPPTAGKQSERVIPTENLDYDRLADFPLSGGNILNIAMNAAFTAAPRGDSARVTMQDVLRATRDEMVKLQHPIDPSDFRITEPMEMIG